MNTDASEGTSFSADFNPGSNRIQSVGGVAGTYDADGNLLNDPSQGTTVVNEVDGEGRQVVFESEAVTCDALGRAVEAAKSGGTVEFLYGPGGGKLAVMKGATLVRSDVPLPGGAEAAYTPIGLTYYRHADHLGSARLASTPAKAVYSAAEYAPYGWDFDDAGTIAPAFTGQKQDSVPGQYDFLMREYSPIQGRWWTPDPAGLAAVDPNNPQTWNRYAYVGGNPLGFVDRLGLHPCSTSSLQRDSHNTVADGDFGPSDRGSDGASEDEQQQGECSPPPCPETTLDGALLPCGLAQGLEFAGGGGGDALDHATACLTALCPVTVPSRDGDPHTWDPVWSDRTGGCETGQPLAFCNGGSWGTVWHDEGPVGGCGWDLACHFFVGFGNLFINNQASGALELG
ncbi:MAG: RHS repeat-associated core domain-containing protein, partial [Terriglobales bacterium]